jgi:hypothetical protein
MHRSREESRYNYCQDPADGQIDSTSKFSVEQVHVLVQVLVLEHGKYRISKNV